MRHHIISAIIAAVVGGGVGLTAAVNYKPKPTVVMPTSIVTRAPGTAPYSTKAEQRQIATAWGDLDQKEVDTLTAALKALPMAPLVIFCQADEKCGDMALDFENAFESAKWKEVKQEAPLIDDTIGVATSREDLRAAIDEATAGRLKVKMIAKNAPYEVLVIGKKPRA